MRHRRSGFTRFRPALAGLHRGFTLIELLLVMSIIGVLAGIVVVALNPSRQFASARNAQRRSDVKTILESIHQHAIDQEGILHSGIDTTWRMIGTETTGCSDTCGLIAEGGGGPTSVTLSPDADTFIYEGSQGTNYGSNVQLWTDPWQLGNARRSLIHFDVSSIPSTASISLAELNLLEADTQGTTRTIAIHRKTASFTENGATWSNAASGYNGAATDTVSVSWSGTFTWNTWSVQSDVQDFVDGTSPNFGWLLKDTAEGTSQFRWQFHSRDAASSANRPTLDITYTDAAGSTAASCLDLSSILPGTYVSSLPADPRYGSGARTQYAVRKDSQGHLLVRACRAELGEEIAVER